MTNELKGEEIKSASLQVALKLFLWLIGVFNSHTDVEVQPAVITGL